MATERKTVSLAEKPDAPDVDAAVVIYDGKVYQADVETLREALECLPLAGGTMTGPLILAADPTEDMGAATKQFVESSIADALGNYADALTDLDVVIGGNAE